MLLGHSHKHRLRGGESLGTWYTTLINAHPPSSCKSLQGLFFRWKFFLGLTTLVALVSVATVVLPSEVLHHWQQGKSYYSFYSKSLFGSSFSGRGLGMRLAFEQKGLYDDAVCKIGHFLVQTLCCMHLQLIHFYSFGSRAMPSVIVGMRKSGQP